MDRRMQRAFDLQEIKEAIARGNPKGISSAILKRDEDDLSRDSLRSLALDSEKKDLLLDFAKRGDPYVVGKVFNDLLGHILTLRDKVQKTESRYQDKSRESAMLHTEAARLEGFLKRFAKVHDEANRYEAAPPESVDVVTQTGEYPIVVETEETKPQAA